MDKPSPMSPLTALAEEQADELFELLKRQPYHKAVKFCRETLNLSTSVSALARWYQNQASERARSDIQAAIRAAKDFEQGMTGAGIEGTERNALAASFWQAVTSKDLKSVEKMGRLILETDRNRSNEKNLERETAAEKRAERAETELAALQKRVREMESAADKAKEPANDTERLTGIKKIFGMK